VDPHSVDSKIGIVSTLVANLADVWSSSIQQDESRAEQLLLEALEHDLNNAAAHGAMGILRQVQDRLSEA